MQHLLPFTRVLAEDNKFQKGTEFLLTGVKQELSTERSADMSPHTQWSPFVPSVRRGMKKVFFPSFFLMKRPVKKKKLSQLVLNGLKELWKSYISPLLAFILHTLILSSVNQKYEGIYALHLSHLLLWSFLFKLTVNTKSRQFREQSLGSYLFSFFFFLAKVSILHWLFFPFNFICSSYSNYHMLDCNKHWG